MTIDEQRVAQWDLWLRAGDRAMLVQLRGLLDAGRGIDGAARLAHVPVDVMRRWADEWEEWR